MKLVISNKLLLTTLLSLLYSLSSHAESSKEYAIMAKSTWSAFECSALADQSQNKQEQERLFKYGYQQGLTFIDAIRENKINKEDLSTEVPLMMGLLLQGPTPDFMLGRVFEGAVESALDNVFKTGDTFNSDEMQKNIAKNEFWKRNCQLIGKQ